MYVPAVPSGCYLEVPAILLARERTVPAGKRGDLVGGDRGLRTPEEPERDRSNCEREKHHDIESAILNLPLAY